MELNKQSLDRYITGNYGEDQFDHGELGEAYNRIEHLEEDLAWLKKEAELHELAMQQNKDRMDDLQQRYDRLRELVAWYFECIDADLSFSWFFEIRRNDNTQIEDADGEFDETVIAATDSLRKAAEGE